MSTVLVGNKGLGDRATEVNKGGDEGRDLAVTEEAPKEWFSW